MLIERDEAERQNILQRLSEIKRRNAFSDKNISHGDLCYAYGYKGNYKGSKAEYNELYIFIVKEGQTAHLLDGSTPKSFPFSVIRPAGSAQIHADEQPERLRADGIAAMVALHSGTAEYAPLQINLSDRDYRQNNAQHNVQGNTKDDDVQGISKEDAQDINDKNNSHTSLNAILPLMTRPTTRAAAAAPGLGIVHYVFAAKEVKPNDAWIQR
jgi:hypothetical protein